ncbi:MAG: hypothetical protein IJZ29_02900 [Clostridia bacterium]|nr:hypothetical protein [Clostridia bacterium]
MRFRCRLICFPECCCNHKCREDKKQDNCCRCDKCRQEKNSCHHKCRENCNCFWKDFDFCGSIKCSKNNHDNKDDDKDYCKDFDKDYGKNYGGDYGKNFGGNSYGKDFGNDYEDKGFDNKCSCGNQKKGYASFPEFYDSGKENFSYEQDDYNQYRW